VRQGRHWELLALRHAAHIKPTANGWAVMRTALPAYLLAWPLLFLLMQLGPISLFIETPLLLVDSRTVFYLLFAVLAAIRLASGRGLGDGKWVAVLAVWLAGYVLSFIANADLDPNYFDFNSGFLCFLAVCLFVLSCRDVIDWELVVKAFAVAMIAISSFGVVSFFRNDLVHLVPSTLSHLIAQSTDDSGLSSISRSWGEQLWRPCGGKTVYIPSAIILFGLYFRSVEMGSPCATLNFAVIVSAVSLLISGQRAAFIALLYLVICVLWRSRTSALVTALVILPLCVTEPVSDALKVLYDATFGAKLEAVAEAQISRVDIWPAAIECLTQNWSYAAFGVSEGCLISASSGSYLSDFSSNPHSLLLYVWASSGLLGVSALGAVIFRLGANAHHGMRLWRILFFWVLLSDLCFAGFGFYLDNVRSDFLNIALLISVGTILGSDADRPERRCQRGRRCA
jgi:hypothetical protein